ncbi:MAG: hypothetical protein JSS82_07250 [Bacteroidetes bacterium]|nr:hypothetical protein [Bacteroidota bacterium]
MKRNVPVLGLVIGLLAPVVGFVIMYFIWGRANPFSAFCRQLMNDHDMASKVLSLALLINLIPFSLYTRKRLDYTARGVLVATVLYAVFILLIKYVW